MSRSESPASSLDFISSDGSASEEEYRPQTHKRAINKRRPVNTNAVASGSGSASATAPKTGIKIRLNLGAAARQGAALHPIDGDIEDDEMQEAVASVMGSRVVDLSNRDLKKDHASRPLWVDEAGQMYVIPFHTMFTASRRTRYDDDNGTDTLSILEAFAPWAQAAQDFLIAIAEPVSRLVTNRYLVGARRRQSMADSMICRPSLVHEYKITKPSLHAAMSVGLETRSITEVLNRLSKIPLPAKLEARIKDWTSSYGKIRLVLKHNKYFLESSVPEFLRILLNDEVIGPCRVVREDEEGQQVFGVEKGTAARRDYFIPGTEEARRAEQGGEGSGVVGRPNQVQRDDVIGAVIGIDQSESLYHIQLQCAASSDVTHQVTSSTKMTRSIRSK